MTLRRREVGSRCFEGTCRFHLHGFQVSSSWTMNPWWWRRYIPSKRREQLIQRRSVTSQTTSIHDLRAVTAQHSNTVSLTLTPHHHRPSRQLWTRQQCDVGDWLRRELVCDFTQRRNDERWRLHDAHDKNLQVRLLTYSMVQSPSWEANWFAASQEIPRILWNPKVHYRTHKRLPPVPILGLPNPVHIHIPPPGDPS